MGWCSHGKSDECEVRTFGDADGLDAVFTLSKITAYARAEDRHGNNAETVSGHSIMPEPELLFHPEKDDERSMHPLDGLRRFGLLAAPHWLL